MTTPSYPPLWLEWEPNTPYYIPGWTTQNPIMPETVGVLTIPGLPADIPIVTVTGTYVNVQGFAYEGVVRFRMGTAATDPGGGSNTRIQPGEIKGQIHNGVLSVNLPAGFTYTVQECIPGGRKFNLLVPLDAQSPSNLDDILNGPPLTATLPGAGLLPSYTLLPRG